MKRTFAISLIVLAAGVAATPGHAVDPAPQPEHRTVMVMGQPLTLRLPADRDRVDWDWRGALGPEDSGEWVVGTDLSYATSHAFAVGGSYAMAVQSRSALKVGDVDPAHYTVFMRWRF